MPDSVIADFIGKFNSTALGYSDPVKGRILLNKKRLVLVAGKDKFTIPLSNVSDVTVGQVPADFGDFFDASVKVAFESKRRGHTASVHAGNEKIQKFSNVLFKVLLNGTLMLLNPLNDRGSETTDAGFTKAKLRVDGRHVTFRRKAGPFRIDLSTVSDFWQTTRTIAGAKRELLTVQHLADGRPVTTVAATNSARKMSLLARYFREEYRELREDTSEIELSEDALEVLVTAYTSGANVSLASVLDKDPSQVTMILNDLTEKDLVRDGPNGAELTPTGRVIVSDELGDDDTE